MNRDDEALLIEFIRHTFATWLSPLALAGGVHWSRNLIPVRSAAFQRPYAVVDMPSTGSTRRAIGGGARWIGPVRVRIVDGLLDDAEAVARSAVAAVPDAAVVVDDPQGGRQWDVNVRRATPQPAGLNTTEATATIVFDLEVIRRLA